MEVLANDNVKIKSNEYYQEIDELVKYINTYLPNIFEYLSLYTDKMCTVRILDSKEELDMLYKELMFDENDIKSHKEVPGSIVSFTYGDEFFILNYEEYIDVYQHSKTTLDDYKAEVVEGLVPIFQLWRYGKLSTSNVVNKGLAAFLSGKDINVRMLIDSFVDLARSGNSKAYGDFYRFLDSTLDRDTIIKLISGGINEDKIHSLYEGYKHQFLASRGKR